MNKIIAHASFGAKLKTVGLGLDQFENVSPVSSIGAERDLPQINPATNEPWTDEEVVARAGRLYEQCRKYVQDRIQEDILAAKRGPKNG